MDISFSLTSPRIHLRLATLLALVTVLLPVETAVAQTLRGNVGGMLLAAKDKKKDKKANKKQDAAAESEDATAGTEENTAATGGGGAFHAKQAGKDGPYKAEIGLSMQLDPSTSRTVETNGKKSDPQTSQGLSLSGSYLFIFRSFAVGPTLDYSQTSTKSKTTTVSGTSTTEKEVKSTNNTMNLGVLGKYYFGKIDKEKVVPVAMVGMKMLTGETKVGDADPSKQSGTAMTLGGGLNYFIASNVALFPSLTYEMQNTTTKLGDVSSKVSETGIHLALGLVTFI